MLYWVMDQCEKLPFSSVKDVWYSMGQKKVNSRLMLVFSKAQKKKTKKQKNKKNKNKKKQKRADISHNTACP